MRRVQQKSALPTEWALRELPARVASFLHLLSVQPEVLAALRNAGYGPADHAEGIALLGAACALEVQAWDVVEGEPARNAEAELHTWANTHLPRLRAAIVRLHPEAVPLFANLLPLRAAQATLAVATLLQRVEQRRKRPEFAAVLATLERRGFTSEQRAQLRSVVTAAQSVSPAAKPKTKPKTRASAKAHELVPLRGVISWQLLALHGWYQDWALTARSVVKRKDWLQRLGVVRRRRQGTVSGSGQRAT